jgi:hypothetical protein
VKLLSRQYAGIEPMGEVFLLTFLFIGLGREADSSIRSIAAQAHWLQALKAAASVNTSRGPISVRSVLGWTLTILAALYR